jgi:REP element-mobilizing transposase RayT
LSDLGTEVQKSIEYICANDKDVEIPQYVIMPNHVHMIVALKTAKTVGHGSPTLQAVVGRIKSYTAKQWREMGDTLDQTFWQRSFHDHIIRDEAEFQRIWQYIDENPALWGEDIYHADTT